MPKKTVEFTALSDQIELSFGDVEGGIKAQISVPLRRSDRPDDMVREPVRYARLDGILSDKEYKSLREVLRRLCQDAMERQGLA